MEGITEMGIRDLRKALTERIEAALHRNEPTIIRNMKRGRPQAALVPYGWLEELYAYRKAAQDAAE
jgi:hypothetical protein